MIEYFTSPPIAPFSLALLLLAGLLTLELCMALIGGSLINADADGIDVDLDVDADFDMDIGDIDALDLDADFDMADPDAGTEIDGVTGGAGALGWLGLGKMPLVIWLASIFFGFGVSGLALQWAMVAVLGFPMPAFFAVAPAGFAAIVFAKNFGTVFARVLPKIETSAIETRRLSRRRGVVTQGVAKRGQPAEVRVKDAFGNLHYLRAEPFSDEDEIPQGTEVLVLKSPRQDGFRILSLGELPTSPNT